MMVKEIVRHVLPRRYHPIAAGVYWFGLKYQCPVCGWRQRAFRPMAALDPTFNDWCSRCGSLGRHRLVWLYLKNKTNFFTAPLKVLHLAAEGCFRSRFRKLRYLDYTVADIAGGDAPGIEMLDVTDIRKPDNLYDVVLCIHVLQHVEDDLRAISEIYRVLKPGGWAILNSRYDERLPTTHEVASKLSPADRQKLMNQMDPLFRVYGRDFKQRIASAGFNVENMDYKQELGTEIVEKYSLCTSGEIYFCVKPDQR